MRLRFEQRALQQRQAPVRKFFGRQHVGAGGAAAAQPRKEFAAFGRSDALDSPVGLAQPREFQQQQLKTRRYETPRVHVRIIRTALGVEEGKCAF